MTTSLASFSETLILVLAHSLWQAAVLCGLIALVLRAVPARRAELRYGIVWSAYLLVVVCAFATWSLLTLDSAEPGVTRTHVPVEQPAEPVSGATAPSAAPALHPWTLVRPRLSQMLAVAWGLGSCLMLIRGLSGQVLVRKWRTAALPLPAESGWLIELLDDLRRQLNLRAPVGIRICHSIHSPAVVGFLQHCILIPPALLTGLPVDQWRVVLAHELAHVRRWDALANLLQTLIDALFFFNPAVVWLSRTVRDEREACCDALAARTCGPALSVARTLVDVAATLPQSPVVAALAFAEPADGHLSDRVTRLVHPEQAPQPRISWATLTGVLAGLLLVLALLFQGTDLVVRAAADWMTPKERVNTLVELEARRNGNIVPLAESPTADSDSSPGPTTHAAVGRIPVHLVIRTSDGGPVTRQLSLTSVSLVGNHSSGNTLNTPREDTAEYRMTLYYPPCQLRIGARQPGYAPVDCPVQMLLPDAGERTIELVLTPGRPLELSVRNPAGQPIAGAWLNASTQLSLRGSTTGQAVGEIQADADGRVTLEHVSNGKYAFHVVAPGYQRLEFTAEALQPENYSREQPYVITLKPARPATVHVTDAAGQPIVGARLRIAFRDRASHQSHYGSPRHNDTPSRWSDYAVSDANGQATLSSLMDDATYGFWVIAPNSGRVPVTIEAGQEKSVSLARPVTLTGQLTGAIERLERKPGDAGGYRFSFQSRMNTKFDENGWIDVSPDGSFQIPDRSVGEDLRLLLLDQATPVRVDTAVAPLKIAIPPAAQTPRVPLRSVHIELTGTSPGALARGTVKLEVNALNFGILKTQAQPVRENRIEVEAPIGARLSFSDEGLVGYRFGKVPEIEVVAGSGPQQVSIPVVAAGGIHGRIRRADGSPADSAFVTVFAARLPQGASGSLNPSSSTASAQFLRSVPLEGVYRILARETNPRGLTWIVSPELKVNSATPIVEVDLQLPELHPLDLRFVDESGSPVPRQNLEIEFAFQCASDPGSRFSTRLPGRVNEHGEIVFPLVPRNAGTAPVTCQMQAVVKPGPMRGEVIPIPATKSATITLRLGVTATGVVIDTQTQRPIPNAEVRIYPRHFDQARFRESITARTDAAGQFTFQGLEPIEYSGVVEQTSPKGSRVTPVGPGLRISTPPGAGHTLTGGTTQPARWEVVIHPNSPLQPN